MAGSRLHIDGCGLDRRVAGDVLGREGAVRTGYWFRDVSASWSGRRARRAAAARLARHPGTRSVAFPSTPASRESARACAEQAIGNARVEALVPEPLPNRPGRGQIEAQRHPNRRRILLGRHGHAEGDYALASPVRRRERCPVALVVPTLVDGKCTLGHLNLDHGAQGHAEPPAHAPCMCSHRRPLLPPRPRRGPRG